MNAKRNVSPQLLAINPHQLAQAIKDLGKQIGFTDVRIAHPDTQRAAMLFKRWEALDNEGSMHYLKRHGQKRGHIHAITPNALSVISVSLNYLHSDIKAERAALDNDNPYLSVYARGRDYHKVMRKMLARFAQEIEVLTERSLKTRAFVDTAPVLDKAYAEQSGIGWVGKHTNILDKHNGSFYFLGELAINLKLPADHAVKNDCGKCRLCLDVCPTRAIIAPYQLDAMRCISYLTIEHEGIIADKFKPLIGNRIYGCDDCQLFCPWNRFAQRSKISDFSSRNELEKPQYIELFQWNEETFLKKTEGSPIRRIGHNRWQRNIAIGIGNTEKKHNLNKTIQMLKENKNPDSSVKDAIEWAIKRLS